MNDECKQLAVDLSAYFDQELDEAETRAVESHLADCADCRESLEKMGRLRAALHTAPPPPLEQKLIQDLMQALRQPERRAGRDLFKGVRGRPRSPVTRGN